MSALDEFLDVEKRVSGDMRVVSEELYALAYALRLTGNHDLAGTLTGFAGVLHKSADALTSMSGPLVTEATANAEQSYTNTVQGVLAGITLGSKSDD